MRELGMCATPATMALGGVPTGRWNAIEHANAAGIISERGSMCSVRDCNTPRVTLCLIHIGPHQGKLFIPKGVANLSQIHTYHSRFIPGGVAEVSQIFIRHIHVLPKLVRKKKKERKNIYLGQTLQK
jgi:hypothetical protein